MVDQVDPRDAQFWFDLGMRIGPRAMYVRRKYEEAKCQGLMGLNLMLYLRRLVASEERVVRAGTTDEG